MALRPIVNFEVDDQPLDRGLQKLQKLHEAAQKFKNDPITLLGKPFGGRGGITEEERAVPFAERLARAWNTMREHSREVIRNVREMQQRFLSLTGWMGLLTGLATAGGAFGLGVLARGVGNVRQQSLEARTSIAGYRAAQIGLTPLLPNVTSMLPRLADAMQDPAGPLGLALRRLNVDPTAAGGDSVRLAEMLIPAIRQWQKNTPEWAQGFAWRNQGLEQIMPFAETRQLSGRTDKEIQDWIGRTERMRGEFEVSPDRARGFQEFYAKLEEAGRKIETLLITKLGDQRFLAAVDGVIGGLTRLSEAFINWALKPENIQWISEGLDKLSNWLKNEDFAADFKKFSDGLQAAIASLTGFVAWMKRWLPGVPTGDDPGKTTTDKPGASPQDIPLNPLNWKWENFDAQKWMQPFAEQTPDITLPLPSWLQPAPEGTPNPLLETRKPSALKTPEERSWWRKYNPFQRSSADELAEQHMKSGDLGGIRYKPAEPQPWLTLQQQQELLAKLYPPKQVSFGGGSAQAFPIYASRPLPVEIVGFRGFGKDKEAPADQPYKGMWQEAAFRTPMNDNILGMIEKYESGGRNIWNWRHAEDPEHFTASGFYQIIDSTWNEAKKRFGVPQSLWPHAMDAPRDVQTMIAEELLRTRGLDPWKTNEPLMRALQGQPPTREPFHPPTRDQVAFTIQNEAGGNLVTTTRRLAVG